MKYIFYFSLFLFVFTTKSFAQPLNRATYEKMLEAAQTSLDRNDYYNALDWYEQAYDDKKDKDIAYKIGKLNLQLRDYVQAEKWLGKVTRIRKNPNPDSRFYLARAMKHNGKYNESIEEFQQFISETPNDSLKKIATLELEGAKMGLKLPENELIIVTNAGNSINTPFADFGVTMANQNEMFYSSFQRDDYITLDGKEGNYQSKIYSASKTGDNWSKGEDLGKEINREGFHTCNPTVSPDGKRMYFNRALLKGNDLSEAEIYVSEKGPEGWTPPLKVKGINGNYIAKQPCVGDLFGKEVLYFSSNMEGGKGGFDLYYATRKEDGSYELPVNLGSSINTSGDEITPFYRDGKLYFSTNGYPSIGGYDIYTSTWNSVNWSKPTNLGKGFNSSADDLYFSTDQSGEVGLLVSNRINKQNKNIKSKTCCDDIYQFKVDKPVIELIVSTFEKGNKELKGSSVNLIKIINDKPTKSESKSANGNKTSFKLEPDRSYLVITSKEGYNPDTLTINTTNTKKNTTIEKKITLRAARKKQIEDEEVVVETNQPIRLNNIYYDYDDDKILPDAEEDLNYLDTLMKKYPDMVIELSSHTDARGNDDYNLKLSQRRAESAKKYLVSKGIKESRIKAVGYGETVLLNECKNGVKCSDAEHRVNRRTEFKILSGPTTITIKKIEKKKKGQTNTDSRNERGGPNLGNTGDSVKSFSKNQPLMSFDNKMIDFGKVKKGEKRSHIYNFKNTGDEPIEIDIVTACECTKVDWTRGKIMPGDSGKINADFDSKEKDESETITITIVLKNTDKKMGYPIIEEVKFKYELQK